MLKLVVQFDVKSISNFFCTVLKLVLFGDCVVIENIRNIKILTDQLYKVNMLLFV